MKKQNVVLKVAVGLVLGIGAMTFAPREAQARLTCTPNIPIDTPPCSVPNPLPPQTLCTTTNQVNDTGCNFDTDGDCNNDTSYTQTTTIVKCKQYLNGVDQPPSSETTCAATTYTSPVSCGGIIA